MNPEEIRNFCLSLPASSEDFPFDADTLAFRVEGKIFALTDSSRFDAINLKCDPERAIELRENHVSVSPGFHMNKKHWNTVSIPGDYSVQELKEWIFHSYEQVVKGLPLKTRKKITQQLPA